MPDQPPAVSEAAFPMREASLADIARRAELVKGLSVQDAARLLHERGECGDAVLEVLGLEVKR